MEMKDKLLLATKWSVVMRPTQKSLVDLTEVHQNKGSCLGGSDLIKSIFSQYLNVEMHLVIHSMKPLLTDKTPTHNPNSIFLDEEFKTHIEEFRHAIMKVRTSFNNFRLNWVRETH
jgi:hypothetical protein